MDGDDAASRSPAGMTETTDAQTANDNARCLRVILVKASTGGVRWMCSHGCIKVCATGMLGCSPCVTI